MKKLLALILALLMIVSLVACGKTDAPAADAPAADAPAAPAADAPAADAPAADAPAEEKPLRIAFSCNSPGVFQDMIIDNIAAWCDENGHEFVHTFNNGDSAMTMADVQTYLNAEYDYLLVYVLDEGVLESVSSLAEGKHTKVMTMGLEVDGYTYISGGNFEGSVMAGEKAWEAVQNKWDGEVDLFCVLHASIWGAINAMRVEGAVKGFCDASGYNPDDVLYLDFDDGLKAQEAFATALSAHPDAEKIVVYGSVDGVHDWAAYNAATAAGRQDQLILTGTHIADERTPGKLVNEPETWIGQTDPMGIGYALGFIEFIERTEAGEDLTGVCIPGSQVWVDGSNVAEYYEVK